MTLSDRLTDKSKEAFCMAIELYNKPTIRYRLEGFSIYHGSKYPQYTYSQQAIEFVFEELKKAPGTILDDMREKTKR